MPHLVPGQRALQSGLAHIAPQPPPPLVLQTQLGPTHTRGLRALLPAVSRGFMALLIFAIETLVGNSTAKILVRSEFGLTSSRRHGKVLNSRNIFFMNGFRKSTSPQNRQLIFLIRNSKQ